MTGSVTWLIITILFSMGIGLNSTSVGNGLAKAIDEAAKNGTYTCSDETMSEVNKLFGEITDPTNPRFWADPILTEKDLENISSNITADDIQRILGNDAWKDFVNNNQNKVGLTTDKTKFNCGDYSFKFGAEIEPSSGTGCQSFAYVDIYYKGELSKTLRSYYYYANYLDYETSYADALPWYNTLCSNMYFDKDTNSVLCIGKTRNEFCFDLSEFITEDVVETEQPSNIGSIADVAISGATIGQLPISADGSITLDDGTKVYPNADGTYTIDGVPYSPTYNLSAYDDTALLDLLQTLVDAQTGSTAGDTSGLLSRILSAVNSLRTTFSTGISSVSSKLADILSAVKSIPSNVSTAISSDLAISDEVKDKAISELKTKVGYSAIQSNVNTISTTFFGERTFNDNGDIVIAPVFDTGETITTQRPHLYFTLFNKQYDLFSGLYMFDGAVNIFKSLVAFFLIVAFILGLFRSLPSILLSLSEVKSITSPTVITNTFSNFDIYQTPNNNKPPKPPKANGKGG